MTQRMRDFLGPALRGGVPWLLTLLLALAFALTLLVTQVAASLVTAIPAGFSESKQWLSVSRGEPDPDVGMLPFSRRQIEAIVTAFPSMAFIAASGAIRTELRVNGQQMDAWVEFVSPSAFAEGGVPLRDRTLPGAGDTYCIPSERWQRTHGVVPPSLGIGGTDVPMVGSVDGKLRMFAGVGVTEIWCSWDLAAGVLVPEGEATQALEVPLYALFAGSGNPESFVEWRERTRALELPMTMGRGLQNQALTSLEGWVTHPAIQRDAVRRASSLSLISMGFLVFSTGLVLFVSFARVRRTSVSLKVRYAMGARRVDILWPAVAMHARALACALLLGGLLAKVMEAALWQDPVLAVARVSGEPLFGDGLVVALIAAAAMALLSLCVDCVFIRKYARTTRLDLSPRSALSGLRATRLPVAIMAAFLFLASWALISQAGNWAAPAPSEFGVSDSASMVRLRFKPDTWVSERTIPAEVLQSLTREWTQWHPGSAIAAVESYPGFALSLDVGGIQLEGERVCGRASEILRATEGLLPALNVPVLAGRPPQIPTEMAMSATRAARCFGSIKRALGARLRLNGEWSSVVGVCRDFNWHLGRAPKTDFLAPLPELPMNLGFVVSGDLSKASLKSLLMNRLGSIQANLREVLVDAFPNVSAELYQNEIAQARQLAMLAALMALACIVASSAYFTSLFDDRRPLLALYVATGATTRVLLRQCLLPLSLITLGACVAIAIPGSRILDLHPTPVMQGSIGLAGWAALSTLLLVTAIAAWQLGAAIRRPALMRELNAA